jgi:hypothetical protein
MSKLKLGPLAEEKPVKLMVELPAAVHRDLLDYARIHAAQTGQGLPVSSEKLIAPMLVRFMATDRVFAKARRSVHLEGGE